MSIAEQIYALVKSLHQEQASEILNFAEFVRTKHLSTHQSVSKVDPTPWTELVYSLAGAWREDFPTLEEIRDESEQDIQRESL
jgi:hypothetical protein